MIGDGAAFQDPSRCPRPRASCTIPPIEARGNNFAISSYTCTCCSSRAKARRRADGAVPCILPSSPSRSAACELPNEESPEASHAHVPYEMRCMVLSLATMIISIWKRAAATVYISIQSIRNQDEQNSKYGISLQLRRPNNDAPEDPPHSFGFDPGSFWSCHFGRHNRGYQWR